MKTVVSLLVELVVVLPLVFFIILFQIMLRLFNDTYLFHIMSIYNYKKLVVSIFLILTTTFQVLSYTIQGKIMSGEKPVSEVIVKISDEYNKELGNAYSDAKGVFMIKDIDIEKIFIEAIGMGYEPLRFEVVTGMIDTDLGILKLDKSINLEEVVVTAKDKISSSEKTVVYVSKLDKERAASPFNMLTILAYKAPQIQVKESDRTLTIEGEEPVILVNGIKRSMAFITSLNPKDIEKIEFSTLPDVRFGKCYLNITTRRHTEGGWIMADISGAVTTPRYFLSGAMEYTTGKNDFLFYYNGGYRHGRKEYIDTQEKYIGRDVDLTLYAEGKPSSTLDKYNNFNLYFTRVPSDKSMFSVTASLNLHNNDRSFFDNVMDFTQNYDRANSRGFNLLRPNLNFYYYIKPSNRAIIEINAVGSFNNNKTYRNLKYSTGYHSLLSTISHTWHFSAEAIWKQKLSFAQLNTGMHLSYNNASNEYTINNANSLQNLSSSSLNAYSSINGQLLTIGYYLSAGISYFRVTQSAISPNVRASFNRNFGNYFNLSYHFRYTPSIPPVSSYNDVVIPVNDLMYHIGVDKLKTQHNLNNQIQIDFNKNKFYLSIKTAIINKLRPLITDYSYQNNPNSPLYGFFIEKAGNGKIFRSYGFDCNIGVSNLWNFLSFSASSGYSHNSLKATEKFKVASWYLDLNMGVYWKGWQLNITGNNLVPSYSLQGSNVIMRHWPYTSLAIYKNLGKWNFHVAWSNILSKYGGRYCTETLSSVVPHSSEFKMDDQGNLIEIGLRYQFTTGKLLNKKNRSINLSGGGENGIRWDY